MLATWKFVLLTVLTFQVFANVANAFRDEMTIGDGCEGNGDCVEIVDAVCDSKIEECVCRDRFVASPNKTVCLKMASETGDECEISDQCKGIPLATCVNGTCVAGDNVYSADESVSGCGNGSGCTSGRCQNGTCVEETFQTLPKDSDILGRRNCTNDSDCIWANESICFVGKCRCRPDFVPSQNLKTCLVKAEYIGDDCVESVQCYSLNESVCMNNKCAEKMKSFLKTFSDEMPPNPLILGSSCDRNDECVGIANSVCNENICECDSNYVTSVSSDSCLEKGENEGDPCEIDKQCEGIKGTFCTGKKCLKPASLGRSLETPRSDGAAGKPCEPTAILTAILIFIIRLV